MGGVFDGQVALVRLYNVGQRTASLSSYAVTHNARPAASRPTPLPPTPSSSASAAMGGGWRTSCRKKACACSVSRSA